MENNEDKAPEHPQEPPLDTGPPINYNECIREDAYSGHMFIRMSPLMQFMDRYIKHIPGDANKNTTKAALSKWRDSSGSYESRPKEIARSVHSQVAAILSRSTTALRIMASETMKDEQIELFEEQMQESMRFAALVEQECERRAQEKRMARDRGNIVWKVIEKKGGPGQAVG